MSSTLKYKASLELASPNFVHKLSVVYTLKLQTFRNIVKRIMPESSNSRRDHSLPPPSYATYAPGPNSSRAPRDPRFVQEPTNSTRPATQDAERRQRPASVAADTAKNMSTFKGDEKATSSDDSAPTARAERSVILSPPSYATYAPGAIKADDRRQLSVVEEEQPSLSTMTTTSVSPETQKGKEPVYRGNKPAAPVSTSFPNPVQGDLPLRPTRAKNVPSKPQVPERTKIQERTRFAGAPSPNVPSGSGKVERPRALQAEYSVYSEEDFKKNQHQSKNSALPSQASAKLPASSEEPTIKSLNTKIKSLANDPVQQAVTRQNPSAPQSNDPRFFNTSLKTDELGKLFNSARKAINSYRKSERSPQNENVPTVRAADVVEASQVEIEEPQSSLPAAPVRRKTYYDEDESPSKPSVHKGPVEGQLVMYQGGKRDNQKEPRAQNIIAKYKGAKSVVPNNKGQMVTVPRYQPLRKGQLGDTVIRALCKVCNTDESEIGAFCGNNVICWDVVRDEYFLDPLWEYIGIPKDKWAAQYEKMERLREDEERKAGDRKSASVDLAQSAGQAAPVVIHQAAPAVVQERAHVVIEPDPVFLLRRRLGFARPYGFCAWHDYYWW